MRTKFSPTRFYLLLLTLCSLCGSLGYAGPGTKRILYLGDSMSMGAFGKTLDQEMRDEGFEVFTVVAGGATPYYWLSRYSTIKGPIGYWEKTPAKETRVSVTKGVPKVETLLERYDPDVVVVQTGTNLYATLRSKRRSKRDNVREVEGLLSHMVEAATQGGRKCYWITPPEAHPGRYPTSLQKELADLTKRVVGSEAKVFDSRKVTHYTDPYPKNDGIHYGPTEAKQWASHVIKDFRRFMGGESRESGEVMIAAAQPVAIDRVPEPTMVTSVAPRAAVTTTKPPVPEEATPPVKKAPVEEVVVAKVTPEVRQMPPALKPKSEVKKKPVVKTVAAPKRPPVQYVKKAIPVEPKGIEWGPVELEVKLVEKSVVKSLKDIDYSYCFAMNEYEVLKVNGGHYPHKRIRIARVVMWSGKTINRALKESVGSSPRGGWKLVPMANYPRFEQMQLVDDLPIDLDLPVYIVAFE